MVYYAGEYGPLIIRIPFYIIGTVTGYKVTGVSVVKKKIHICNDECFKCFIMVGRVYGRAWLGTTQQKDYCWSVRVGVGVTFEHRHENKSCSL